VSEVTNELERWRDRGDRHVVVATLVTARGSAPRPIGSRLAVSERGELAGSVSGGCVESEVAELARAVFADGEQRQVTYGISDEQAFSVGLPCGGEIDVLVERAGMTDFDRFRDESPYRLLVFGAVDLGEALCRAAKALGWRTIAADPRAKFATRERIPSADELLVEWPDEVLARVKPDAATAIVVLAHEDQFDIPALVGALGSDAFYVGALGARKNQERRRARLVEEGLTEDEIDRIAGPTGLDVGAETPAETAVSILAEVLAVRSGRAGGPLRDSRGRIHAELQRR
jgi:xanthine dehydrogenase accessory factor